MLKDRLISLLFLLTKFSNSDSNSTTSIYVKAGRHWILFHSVRIGFCRQVGFVRISDIHVINLFGTFRKGRTFSNSSLLVSESACASTKNLNSVSSWRGHCSNCGSAITPPLQLLFSLGQGYRSASIKIVGSNGPFGLQQKRTTLSALYVAIAITLPCL